MHINICNLCHQSQHKDCFKDLIKMKPFYICPMCYFDINDIFLNKIDNILKPVDIIPHTLKHRSTFRFRKDFNKKENDEKQKEIQKKQRRWER